MEEEGMILEGDGIVLAVTLDQVSGMLHAASMAKSRIQELEMTAKSDHERIDHMLAEATEVDRRTIADITAQIEQYWLRRLEEQPNGKKSVSLAWGSIAARTQAPEYVKDDAVLTEWAEQNGRMREKVVREVDWAAVKEDLRRGIEVPGVEIVERADKVVVTVDS